MEMAVGLGNKALFLTSAGLCAALIHIGPSQAFDAGPPSPLSAAKIEDACKAVDRLITLDVRPPNDGELAYYCLGFMYGLVAGIRNHEVAGKICLPGNVSIDQMRRVVLTYISDHPETLTIDASWAALEALIQAFPCPRGAAPRTK